ncbi:glycine-rich RNA-binding protein 5, mitochondrial-like isoform X2 [Wolffia australiana]
MRRLISSEIFLGRHGWRRLSSQASPRTWTLFVGGKSMDITSADYSTAFKDRSSGSGTIAGLSYDTNEAAMKDAFEQHGEVIAVNVICDRVSGRSRGFGFVKFAEEDAAMNALREMDGQEHSRGICKRYSIHVGNLREEPSRFILS